MFPLRWFLASLVLGPWLAVGQQAGDSALLDEVLNTWRRLGQRSTNLRIVVSGTTREQFPGSTETDGRAWKAEVLVRYPRMLVRYSETDQRGDEWKTTVFFDGERIRELSILNRGAASGTRPLPVLAEYPPLNRPVVAAENFYPFQAAAVMDVVLIGPQFDDVARSWVGITTDGVVSADRDVWRGRPAIRLSHRRALHLPEEWIWVGARPPYVVLGRLSRGISGGKVVEMRTTTYKWAPDAQWPEGLLEYESEHQFGVTRGKVVAVESGVVRARDVAGEQLVAVRPGMIVQQLRAEKTLESEEFVLPGGDRVPVELLPEGFLERYRRGEAELSDLKQGGSHRWLFAVGLVVGLIAAFAYLVGRRLRTRTGHGP